MLAATRGLAAAQSASTVGTGGASAGAGGSSGTIGSGGSAAAGGTSASGLSTGGTSTGAAGTSSSVGAGGSAAGKAMSQTHVNGNADNMHAQTKDMAHDGGTFSKVQSKTTGSKASPYPHPIHVARARRPAGKIHHGIVG